MSLMKIGFYVSASPQSLAITWALSTVSGYGMYGLQLALQFLRRGGQQLILTRAPSVTELPPLLMPRLAPIYTLGQKLDAFLRENPQETLSFKHAVLHGSGSDFSRFPGQERIWGEPNVACCAIEHLVCSESGRAVAKNYDAFISISRWNDQFLRSLNVGPVHLCYQGIDSSLFHPAPRNGLHKNRFVIFSGGKFEFRKGQDIVIAAFKRFRARHPEALLITCWQNITQPEPELFKLAGHCQSMPRPAKTFGIDLTPWLREQGLPEDSFIDLPFTHNLLMPSVLRECDVAIFPNRCEGGTNLVAMEAMACGVPTYVSYNTGQKDLVDLIGCGAFKSQKPVKGMSKTLSLEDWGETEVEEVVEVLEQVYTHRQDSSREGRLLADRMVAWQWGPLNEKFLKLVCDQKAEAA